jgi:hypothetical protein
MADLRLHPHAAENFNRRALEVRIPEDLSAALRE